MVCPLTVDDKIAGFPDTGPRRSFVPILLVGIALSEYKIPNSRDQTHLGHPYYDDAWTTGMRRSDGDGAAPSHASRGE